MRIDGSGGTPADLTDAIDQLQGLENAVRREKLRLIAAYDREGFWADDGVTSMADWYSFRYGTTAHTAREEVRIAHALDELPAVAGGYADNRLSGDKVRDLTRFATPAIDAEVATEAEGVTAAAVRQMARHHRPPTPEDDQEAHRRRSLRLCWDPDKPVLHLSGHLPAAAGAIVEKTLDRIAEGYPPDPITGVYEDYESRRADAFVEICSARLGADQDPGRATVVVHADIEALAEGRGAAELERGAVLSWAVARRLACDARVELTLYTDGTPAEAGRTARTIPPRLNRQMRRRDGGICAFPGCTRRRLVEGHHVVHWAQGGTTVLTNLVSLCWWHHRLVHEGGWTIRGRPGEDLVFVRPDGIPIPARPPRLREDLRRRILGPVAADETPDYPSAPAPSSSNRNRFRSRPPP